MSLQLAEQCAQIDRSGDTDRGALACLQNERSCPAKQVLDRIYACMASSYSPGIKIVGGRNPLLDAMIGRHEAHQAGTTSTSCLDGLHCPHAASPVNMSCRIIAVSMKGTN